MAKDKSTKAEKADRAEAAKTIETDTVASYTHPETGAEVVDVVCPKHPKMKGHVVTSQLGLATCGTILKSHKEPFEESVDGKTVKGSHTVVDEECKVLLVPAKNKKKDVSTAKGPHSNVAIDADENLASPGEAHHSPRAKTGADKTSTKASGKKTGKRHPAAS